MTKHLKKRWREAGTRAKFLCLLLLAAVGVGALLALAAGIGPDSDSDGMSDAFETLFSLDPYNPADAQYDYDLDTLINLDESRILTDPHEKDTDRDLFPDNEDSNAVSRMYVHFGDPLFTDGDLMEYTWPAWAISAYKTDGQWTSNPPSWYMQAEESNDIGSLHIEVDRSILTNNAVLRLDFHDRTNASLFVDLYDTNNFIVARDLFGNLMLGSDHATREYLNIPFETNTQAVGILIRRGSGDITVYEGLLYVDEDGDGLDREQEDQLNTSDKFTDSDGDGLSDPAEVFAHGTNPARADSDNDGLNDFSELYTFGANPLDPDTDNDGVSDGREALFGNDPAISNAYSVLPFTELFETNTVTQGEINGQNNWTAEPLNAAFVQTNIVYQGQQALEVDTGTESEATVRQVFNAPEPDAVWMDLRIKVIGAQQPEGPLDTSAAMYIDNRLQLVVYDGKRQAGDEWRTLTNYPPLIADEWVRLSVKLDYSVREWLVCLNGMVVADGLGFAGNNDKFAAFALQSKKAFADNLTLGADIPPDISQDWDNLPDNWELQYFPNLDQIDSGDPDADGLSNIDEYEIGTDPGNADTDSDGLSDYDELNVFNTDPLDDDSDNDGATDGAEVRIGTDPLDPGSFPAAISGSITYSGSQTGAIHVTASINPNVLLSTFSKTITIHQSSFVIEDLPNRTNYWISAYRDSNGNASNDFWEANGGYAANPVYLTNDISGTDFSLTDPDTDNDGLPDWWEISRFGDISQAADDDADSDGLSNLGEHQYGTNPNVVDSDGDGVKDGMEVSFGNNPAVSNAYSALPFVELFETNTVTQGELNGQNNWTADPLNAAFVQTNVVYQGQQALEVDIADDEATVRQVFTTLGSYAVWMDVYLQAIPSLPPQGPLTTSAAMFFDGDLRLVVYDGKRQAGDEWITLTNHAPIESEEWVRLSVKLDYSVREWLVCLNGMVVADGLGFAGNNDKFAAFALQSKKAFADNLTLGADIPPDISQDWDNLPDNWELRYFPNLDQTDGGDPDNDGLSNIEEYGIGTDPGNADTDNDGLSDYDELNVFNTDPLDDDSDNDGATDGAEVRIGTDPLDPDSFPASISGTITYSGSQTGTIHVAAAFASNHLASAITASLDTLGIYTIANVPNRADYWINAYRDSNGNASNDFWEARGGYAANPVYLTNDIAGIDFSLSDPDTDEDSMPDWWEVRYLGNIAAAPNDDSDGDGLSNVAEYQIGLDPGSRDSDSDGVNDGTEVAFGNDPAISNAYSALPFIEMFETNTVTQGELNGQNNWETKRTNTAFVQTNVVYQGQQALEAYSGGSEQAVVRHLFDALTQSIVWADMYVKAVAALPPEGRPDMSAAMYFDNDLHLVVYDGATNQWIALTNHDAIASGQWVRLTVKLDYSACEWLVCLDGPVIAPKLGFASPRSDFAAFALECEQGFADNFSVSATKPLHLSFDGDRLSDDWEIERFENLDQDDEGDPDGDSLSNLGEYRGGTDPNEPDTDFDGFNDPWEVLYAADADYGAFFDPVDASLPLPAGDPDNDGLDNSSEYARGTSPVAPDTDNDGLSDSEEVNIHGTNPLNADTDADTYPDKLEIDLGFDPNNPASYPYDAWRQRMKLSFRNSDQAESLAGVPILVVLNPERVDYADFQGNGTDLRFSVSDATELDYEIEEWNTNGSSYVWVRAPEIPASGIAGHVWMHWGNALTTTDVQNAAGVWGRDYAGVWHLNEKGNTLADSTANGNNGINNASVLAEGRIGRARRFAVADYISIPAGAFVSIQNEVTVSLWQYGDESQPVRTTAFEGRGNGLIQLRADLPRENGWVYWFALNDAAVKLARPEEYKGRWNHWTFSKNRATGIMAIYLNGELWHQVGNMKTAYDPITVFNLGSKYDGRENYAGRIDEFRVSTVARSHAWIQTQYKSMTDTLLIYGAQEVGIAAGQNAAEPNTGGSFIVFRNNVGTNFNLTVHYGASGAAIKGADYAALTGSVTIPAGAVQATIPVDVLDDYRLEGAEDVVAAITDGNYLISAASNSAAINIADNDVDTDMDGLANAWEILYLGGLSALADDDADGDGLSNIEEFLNRSNPNVADSDNDGLSDYDELNVFNTEPSRADSDSDGMPDNWELANGLAPNDSSDASADPDGDLLRNLAEYQHGFDPNAFVWDTDGDGLTDAEEVYVFLTNPSAADSDNDGANDMTLAVAKPGVDTSRRTGWWAEDGDVLYAQSNFFARLEYEVNIADADMYKLGIQITNANTQATNSYPFSLHALIDGAPINWLHVNVTPGATAWGYILTPWLSATNHTIRFAWLDNYDTNKMLGVEAVVLERIDAPDTNANGRQDWIDTFLAQGNDTDEDGLSDLDEIDAVERLSTTSALEPVKVDTDSDTLSDAEELALFNTDPLSADSDNDGILDATLVADKDGTNTSARVFRQIGGKLEDYGSSLVSRSTWITSVAYYDFTVTEAGIYRVALQLRNWGADPMDNYKFKVRLRVNDHYAGTFEIFADIDLSGRGYLNTPWLPAGTHRIGIEWVNNSYANGRDSNIAIEKAQLYAVDGPDANANGMQDWMETILAADGTTDTDGDGLSDRDEITLHGTSPVLKDTDGDGLTDFQEVSLGTDPLDADSDNDGIFDREEVFESRTNPLVPEFDGTVTNVAIIAGAATNAALGKWEAQGTEIVAKDIRGFVEYTLSAPAAGMYRLKIEATHLWSALTCSPAQLVKSSDLMIYMDGNYLGTKTLTAPDGIYGSVVAFTPWLAPGPHTVRIYWENVHKRLSLKIRNARLQQLGGPDADNNGVQDWIEVSVGNMTSLDTVHAINHSPLTIPNQTYVSPVCIEGAARYVDMMSVSTQGLPCEVSVKQGAGDRWYADVPLSPSAPTEITVSFQSGALSRTTNIIWVPLNVLAPSDVEGLEAGNLRIRKGDSLMLTAVPEGAVSGTVTIEIAGVTNYRTTVDAPVIHHFDQAGVFTVSGSHNDGTVTTGSITVTVVEALFPTESPACMYGAFRSWSVPDIPTDVILEADETVELARNNQAVVIRVWEVNERHYMVARLYEGGPIMANVRLDTFWIQAAVDSFMWIIERYPDGSGLWENQIVVKNLPPSVDIELKIIIAGVTFDDMSLERWITADDFDALGQYNVRLIRPASVSASACHTIKAYQNGVFLGEAYYAGYLFGVPDVPELQ